MHSDAALSSTGALSGLHGQCQEPRAGTVAGDRVTSLGAHARVSWPACVEIPAPWARSSGKALDQDLAGGFYPAHEQAIAHAAALLRPPVQEPFAILDPCAGEGAALRQIAELLGCPLTKSFAIELDVNGGFAHLSG